jgi:hypothetical protein
MKWKAEKLGLPEFFNKEDEEEIRGWSKNKIKIIESSFQDILCVTDSIICPWCILSYNNFFICCTCSYGKRHGHCLNDMSSQYRQASTKGSIVSTLGAECIISKIEEIFGVKI